MKPTLTRIMVSGIFTLLVTFAFSPKLDAKPAGYTSDGQPYYYAYPDEGYAEPTPPAEPNPFAYNYPTDESGYNEPSVDYYDAPWGWWGWGWGGWPIGFGDGFNFDFKRHHGFNNRFHNNNRFFARHNGFNQKFVGNQAIAGHSAIAGRSAMSGGSAVVPHQSVVGNRSAGAHVSRGGRGFSGGGGGRHR